MNKPLTDVQKSRLVLSIRETALAVAAAGQYDTAAYEHHKAMAFDLIAEVKAERQELVDLDKG